MLRSGSWVDGSFLRFGWFIDDMDCISVRYKCKIVLTELREWKPVILKGWSWNTLLMKITWDYRGWEEEQGNNIVFHPILCPSPYPLNAHFWESMFSNWRFLNKSSYKPKLEKDWGTVALFSSPLLVDRSSKMHTLPPPWPIILKFSHPYLLIGMRG